MHVKVTGNCLNLNVKGISRLHCFLDVQGIMDRDRSLDISGLIFEFLFGLLIHFNGDCLRMGVIRK
jgi:hypothetical protein